jgi:hypothetical protein
MGIFLVSGMLFCLFIWGAISDEKLFVSRVTAFSIGLTLFEFFLGFFALVSISLWFYFLQRQKYLTALFYSGQLRCALAIACLSIFFTIFGCGQIMRFLRPERIVFHAQGDLFRECMRHRNLRSHTYITGDGKIHFFLETGSSGAKIHVFFRHQWRSGFWGAVALKADCTVPPRNIFADPAAAQKIAASFGDSEYVSGRNLFYKYMTPIFTIQMTTAKFEQMIGEMLQSNMGSDAEPALDSAPKDRWRLNFLRNTLISVIFLSFFLLMIYRPPTSGKKFGMRLLCIWVFNAAYILVTASI